MVPHRWMSKTMRIFAVPENKEKWLMKVRNTANLGMSASNVVYCKAIANFHY